MNQQPKEAYQKDGRPWYRSDCGRAGLVYSFSGRQAQAYQIPFNTSKTSHPVDRQLKLDFAKSMAWMMKIAAWLELCYTLALALYHVSSLFSIYLLSSHYTPLLLLLVVYNNSFARSIRLS